MLTPGRKYSATNNYRYGFNGKENDNEVKGEGDQQDYGMRIYDPRLGKFLSVDPLTKDYPWYTPYSFAGNKPISYIDLDGSEENTTSTYVYHGPKLLNQPKQSQNSTIGLNLGALKIPKASYDNATWFSVNAFQPNKIQTFANNVGVSAWNQAVGSTEFSVNYLTSKNYRKQVEASTTKKILDFITWFATTNARQKVNQATTSAKNYVTDVNTWEDFGGTLLLGAVTENFSSFKAFGNLPITAPSEIVASDIGKVGRRLLGLKDRRLSDLEIRIFGSVVSGAPNPNDVDVLLITNNTSLFESGGRLDKILESIKSDFKNKTGKDLDVNIMSRETFTRAKGGAFKAGVDKNSIKLN